MNKAGVAGLGAMGRHHVRVYHELGVLGAVCDTDASIAKELGEKYQVPWFEDVETMLGTVNLDCMSIATPTQTHYPLARLCLEYSLPVLVEKPICDNLQDASALLTMAQNAKTIIAVGYIERFNPAFRALCSLIQREQLGEIISIHVKRVGGTPRSADNVILDLMTHDLDLALSLFGETPDYIVTSQHARDTLVNAAQCLLQFGSASVTCEANWISPVKIRRWEVTGTLGYCEVDLITQKIIFFNPTISASVSSFSDFVLQYGEPSHQVMVNFRREPLKDELAEFLVAVTTGKTENIVTVENSLQTLSVTLQAMGEDNVR